MKDNTAEIANLERVLEDLESELSQKIKEMGAIEFEMDEIGAIIDKLKGE